MAISHHWPTRGGRTTRPLGKHLGFVGRVGGWSHQPTHLKKYARQIGSSPMVEGVNMINIGKLPPYGETTYNKHLNGLTSPDFVQVWGWFHMVGGPPKNLPNLYEYHLWTRNLDTNLCRWLGFVDVYYFIHDLSKSLQPQKNLHKLRWWWGLERLLTGFHWVPCLDTRPNPKMATNLWCKFPPPTKKHIAPEKWCNRKMNFPNFFPILGCIQITVFRGLFRPLVSWRVDPILQTFETSKAWGFRAVDFPPRGWHFCLIMVMEKTYPQCLWESPQTPVSIWATD